MYRHSEADKKANESEVDNIKLEHKISREIDDLENTLYLSSCVQIWAVLQRESLSSLELQLVVNDLELVKFNFNVVYK